MKSDDNISVLPIKDTFSATFYQPSQTLRGKLVVHGEVRRVTPGWCLKLISAIPPGAKARELRLVLEAIPPKGIPTQNEVETEVSYVRAMEKKLYDTISISNTRGPGLSLDVAILVSETWVA